MSIKANIKPDPIFPSTQVIKDTESILEISVFDGTDPVDVSGMTTKLKWTKPFGAVLDIKTEIESQKVLAYVPKEATDEPDQATCILTLKKGETESKAFFFVYVEDIRE